LGFTDQGAYTTAPALLGVDHSLQPLGALYLLHLNSVKLAAIYTVLAPIAQLRVDSGLIPAFGEDFIVRYLAYVGIMPNRAAASTTATQCIRLNGFDFGVIHPYMHQSILFILVNDGHGFIHRYTPPMSSAQGVLR